MVKIFFVVENVVQIFLSKEFVKNNIVLFGKNLGKKKLGVKNNIWSKNLLGPKIFFGSKIFLGQKIFWTKKFFLVKKFLGVKKNLWVRKILGRNNFLVKKKNNQKIFGSKSWSKIFWVRNFFLSRIFWVKKFFGSK